MNEPGHFKIHAIVGRARRLGFILAMAGFALAVAGKRNPDMPTLKWVALGVILVGVTLLLAAITHRMAFQKLDLLAEEEKRRDAE